MFENRKPFALLLIFLSALFLISLFLLPSFPSLSFLSPQRSCWKQVAPLQCLRHERQEAWTQELREHFEDWVTPAWKKVEGLEGKKLWGRQKSGKRCRQVCAAASPKATCGKVLYNASSRGVENDVGTIIKVMQVVPAVKSSVAKHVVQSQLLHAHT